MHKIYKGGSGIVELVRDPDTKYEYAVKTIYTDDDPEGCRRELSFVFDNIINKINLSHVVKYYMFYGNDECVNFFMEYCRGGGLDNYIKQRNNYPFAEEVFFFVLYLLFWIFLIRKLVVCFSSLFLVLTRFTPKTSFTEI
jgi:serine/threonine protein kinase